ncbi:Nuclear actin-protein involved in chromatin remodeling [Dispira parvispora]|uniref:Nuclear actin-protein involved in chromatin remodeling n=1 Tax=Dispira parvispora TaxID=1520584 RepID=A0A9W8ALF5_9FUNG|nr:Nuclear actin-protein involved in chromatin remodeling [Dispira parvispora]
MTQTDASPEVYSIPEGHKVTELQQPQTDYKSQWQGTNTPIVIDFGSWRCRAGWAAPSAEETFRPRLDFENALGKFKDRKINQGRQTVLVGDDMYSVSVGRLKGKSPFDGGVICNVEPMESILDYTMLQLGIQSESIDHPVVMTEPLCVPGYHRQLVSELLFEGYGVPSVAYGVDSLFSYYENHGGLDHAGVLLSCGHTGSHVIPITGGQAQLDSAKRLAFGGQMCVDGLFKLLQLKYPVFPDRITPYQVQHMVHHHTYFANDYKNELSHYRDHDYLANHDRVIQYPYTVETVVEKSEEELERLAQKRREQMKRMQEIAAKNRLEKLIRNEQDLETFTRAKEAKKSESKTAFNERLKALGFRNETELDDTIKKLQTAINRAQNKDLGDDKSEAQAPSFPLVNIPDEELNDADRREKKKQRLLKAGFDARERAQKAKEEAKLKEEEAIRKDEERRLTDPMAWLEELKRKRWDLKEKMEQRTQVKQQLANRHSHLAQMRMKNISALASNDVGGLTPGMSPSVSGASGEGGANADVATTGRRRRRAPTEDTFGADDSDWAIYRAINREEGSEDEEEEENDQALLIQYEELLEKHDPGYLKGLVLAENDKIRHSTMYQFTRGVANIPEEGTPEDTAQHHQLHLNVERIRVPEALFQPQAMGIEQAGLVEIIDGLYHQLGLQNLRSPQGAQYLFCTGGSSLIPHLKERLQYAVQSIIPVGTPVHVQQARDPLWDSWRGAARWASTLNQADWARYAITKADYEEYGPRYLKENPMGNRYFSPKSEPE